ncbi:MAG: chemotaxis protein [Epsilonproteobacteria bacterium]|uniref:chemotaxis protein n=1 Tax=Sulfurospirillum TaxID=57665 RepID=UPI0005437B62|nr:MULTISPECIES: chemotaxis protein [Sulfurospirillum]KHG34550.1 MAG: chemotaxis protein [Sulfurospirillum sp. MES]MDY0265444.1 chemotaxis protein [Sulfurospirillum cavolei]NCB54735.1 chemotaxis protein [Campylobacterota bacterium]
MTQEELDALMAGDLDDADETLPSPVALDEESDEGVNAHENQESDMQSDENSTHHHKLMHEYRPSSTMAWPPPPPTDDHKMVHQLDDVTKDSEIKATQVFDKLETVNNFMMSAEENAKEVIKLIESNIALFETLVTKFPKIEQFQNALDDNKTMKVRVEDMLMNAQMAEDEIMMTMDIMQYQDIHRQKIERVINVMRALSKYMSALFEGAKDDTKRVSSAVHIHGDETTEDVVSNEDIEALIASLGKK